MPAVRMAMLVTSCVGDSRLASGGVHTMRQRWARVGGRESSGGREERLSATIAADANIRPAQPKREGLPKKAQGWMRNSSSVAGVGDRNGNSARPLVGIDVADQFFFLFDFRVLALAILLHRYPPIPNQALQNKNRPIWRSLFCTPVIACAARVLDLRATIFLVAPVYEQMYAIVIAIEPILWDSQSSLSRMMPAGGSNWCAPCAASSRRTANGVIPQTKPQMEEARNRNQCLTAAWNSSEHAHKSVRKQILDRSMHRDPAEFVQRCRGDLLGDLLRDPTPEQEGVTEPDVDQASLVRNPLFYGPTRGDDLDELRVGHPE
ncbi:hypothetical protein K438DRAFT_1932607 [Mycena galopus ATCC 62051]|nr:hypothetical protein K438DRAFT_1932607 [Mycena galopus ATCC 62051]